MAICTLALLSGSQPTEMLAVAIGCRAKPAVKRAVQGLGVLDADAARDGRHGEIGRLEQAPGRLDPKLLDEGRRRRPGLATEHPCERARAHPDPLRQCIYSEVLVEVVAEPGLQLGDRRRRGALGPQLGAELGLAAGSLHEDDQPPSRLVRQRRAVVGLHHGEEEIDPRGYARRGPPVAVVDVDPVRPDAHLGMTVGERITRCPVRGRLVTVEQTSSGEHLRAGADGRDPRDRKSTRLNSSHTVISYAVFCLKKKKNERRLYTPEHKKSKKNST